jgi:hypothetical protein
MSTVSAMLQHASAGTIWMRMGPSVWLLPEPVAMCFRLLDLDSTHVVGKPHKDPIAMFVGANVKCKARLGSFN